MPPLGCIRRASYNRSAPRAAKVVEAQPGIEPGLTAGSPAIAFSHFATGPLERAGGIEPPPQRWIAVLCHLSYARMIAENSVSLSAANVSAILT